MGISSAFLTVTPLMPNTVPHVAIIQWMDVELIDRIFQREIWKHLKTGKVINTFEVSISTFKCLCLFNDKIKYLCQLV